MIIRNEILIKLNNKYRIQVAKLQLDYNEFGKVYSIYRINYQYDGKQKESPVVFINSTKKSKTFEQQAGVEFANYLRHYLNSGYKRLCLLTKKKFETLSEEDLIKLLNGAVHTDSNNVPKQMLAKSYNECNPNIFEQKVYVCRNLDSVKVLFYYKDGQIRTASKGGLNYDTSTEHIRTNKKLIELFKANNNLILDGELYHMGWSLHKIIGACNNKNSPFSKDLHFYIFDYISKEPFSERIELLNTIRPLFNDDDHIHVMEYTLTEGWLKVKKLHDKFIYEGYEGLCAKIPNKPYGIGMKSSHYMIKLKAYQTADFEIMDFKKGFREEDIWFTLKTETGKQFTTKPIGDARLKMLYLNKDNKYIGKIATCKFFYTNSEGIPVNPIFQSIRYKEDL